MQFAKRVKCKCSYQKKREQLCEVIGMLINFNIGILSQGICKSSWCILLNKWRIARRDKKDFLNEQQKEIEENNRMGKAEVSSKKLEISQKKFLQGLAQ